ncbi:MAG: PIG-L family deacetylase [Rothia sp. (in: high G+C Gram-positive bacteria)]|nr:PIG-L family deacetylase [Rothia sp. (in: high G+C Gram-positive bacteria)]
MSFSHLASGTSETLWAESGVSELPALSPDFLTRFHHAIVVIAHPDDEVLGCALLLAELARTDVEVDILLCTDGENSHPNSPTHSAAQLAARRHQEFAALTRSIFGDSARVHSTALHLRDSGLEAHQVELETALDDLVQAAEGSTLIIAPYRHDGHCDHDVAGAVAVAVAHEHHCHLLEYPIWYWHWATPADLQWRSWVRFAPQPHASKADWWKLYPSQFLALSELPGDEPIIHDSFRAHFDRPFETFQYTPAEYSAPDSAKIFDAVHRRKSDPWDLFTSPYEIDKRQNFIDALSSAQPHRTLEIGCSSGALSLALSNISAQVVAVDSSAQALQVARQNTASATTIDFQQLIIPQQWPEGTFDLFVLSETGFYFSHEQLSRVFDLMEHSSAPDFRVALCHWRGEINDWPLDAQQVHAQAALRWGSFLEYTQETTDYVIDIYHLHNTYDPAEKSTS